MPRLIDLRRGENNELYDMLLSRNQMKVDNIEKKVEEIIQGVKLGGNKALFEYTKKFDGANIDSDSLKVTEEEIEEAYENTEPELLNVIRRAKANIEAFHEKQKENSWFTPQGEGIILGQMYRAIERVGVYVPGGSAPLPSSVLMNVIPAKVAGVEKIIMATPPGKEGKINPAILAAAKEAGVHEIYKMGGAQAIAAMAFGTESVPKADKITGPGNIFVATAKRAVYGYCDIDMIAGPSEIMVLADETADPRYAAADMLSQAEHDPLASSIVVTVSEKLAGEIKSELTAQTKNLSRNEIIEKSLSQYGAIVLVNSIEEGIEIVNRAAPEHLELCVAEPFGLLGSIKNAGAIFLGSYTPEPLGDYYAGPNHVLPTSGTARFYSPLNVGDFIKKTSIISYTKKALGAVKDDVIRFAQAEGLTAHANAVRIRFEGED